MSLKNKIKYLFQKYGFSPRKKFSQNFLIDEHIISRLVEEMQLKEENSVLEIGAGTGTLTSQIVDKVKRVWAVEIDKVLCQILKDELNNKKNLEIIQADITELEIERLISPEEKIKVVGNLPYHIASFLVLNFVQKKWLDTSIFTVQREVADKILSPPGDKRRGTLTVLISYYAQVEKVIDIPPQAFYPPPRISSTVIRMRPTKEKRANNPDLFAAAVKAGFSARRKMLFNSLSKGLGIPKNQAKNILTRSGISEKKRAEQLSTTDFVKISNELLEEKFARQ